MLGFFFAFAMQLIGLTHLLSPSLWWCSTLLHSSGIPLLCAGDVWRTPAFNGTLSLIKAEFLSTARFSFPFSDTKAEVEITYQPDQAKNLMLLFAGLNVKQMPNQQNYPA